jgi:ATP-dependent protease HslVU (ClpYQ) peptidase subunit
LTTIACDGKSMAGDGLCLTGGDSISSTTVVKVRRLAGGGLVGVAGSAFDVDTFVDWLNSDRSEKPLDTWEKSEALVLEPDGKAYFYNSTGKCFETSIPAATGSGVEMAMAAMACGKTAKEAVEIACLLHSQSGGLITELRLAEGSKASPAARA